MALFLDDIFKAFMWANERFFWIHICYRFLFNLMYQRILLKLGWKFGLIFVKILRFFLELNEFFLIQHAVVRTIFIYTTTTGF